MKQQNIKKDWILFFGNELQFEEQKILEKKCYKNFMNNHDLWSMNILREKIVGFVI